MCLTNNTGPCIISVSNSVIFDIDIGFVSTGEFQYVYYNKDWMLRFVSTFFYISKRISRHACHYRARTKHIGTYGCGRSAFVIFRKKTQKIVLPISAIFLINPLSL